MPTQEDINQQLQLLQTHRYTLFILLRQLAMHGSAYAPPGVMYGIHEARTNIQHLKKILREWGVSLPDNPSDEELPVEPLIFHDVRQIQLERGQGDIEESTTKRANLLVVDQDPATAKLYKFLLELNSYRVVISKNSSDALDDMSRDSFDAVILEARDRSDIEIIRRIKAKYTETQIVVIASLDQLERRVKLLRIGISGYLVKPFDFEELEQLLHVTLRLPSE